MLITDDYCRSSHQLFYEFNVKLPPSGELMKEIRKNNELNYWKDLIVQYLEKNDDRLFFESELLEIGEYYYNTRQFQEAAIVFQINTIQYPLSFYSWKNLGKCYLALQDYSQALTYYYEALDLQPNCTGIVSIVNKISQYLTKGEAQ